MHAFLSYIDAAKRVQHTLDASPQATLSARTLSWNNEATIK